ncbi:MAG: aminoacyl-tRNA hydrolase [Alphaproteobacteria bacterium]|nr:aminoacyl-tRNA hydrolase [Alphaproteobacteria bacterium]
MLLLVGLGNPGPGHAGNRHNIGFMAADAIVRRHGFKPPREKFQAHLSEGRLGDERVLVLKPMTWMNRSGAAVGEAMRFYKLTPADIVVFHDELDLPPGKIRMKRGGGSAGHNGLRSLDAHIGPDYRRCRIGIGHPGERELVMHWVLQDFAKSDRVWLEPLLEAIAEASPLLAEGRDSAFASKVHLILEPPAPKAAPAAPTEN